MASNQMYGVLAIILAVLPAFALAEEFLVGDENGWTTKFDYKSWAAGKDFRVGDTLVFKYPVGVHNVFKVTGPDFQNCTVSPANHALTTGNDNITLTTEGRKWYICGVGNHCLIGQKLTITVLPALEGPSLPPAPSKGAPAPSSAKAIVASGYHALVAVIAVISMVVMV